MPRSLLILLLLLSTPVPLATAQEAEAEPPSLPEKAARKIWEDARLPSLAFAVVTDRGVVLERCWGTADRETGAPATPTTLYEIGSVTKPLTALAVLSLRDEGRLALDDALARWLPEGTSVPADPRGSAITLRQLLTHASGLPRNPVVMPGPETDPWKGVTRDVLLGGLTSTRLQAPAGERYEYSNLGYALLGPVVEKASGRPFAEALRERVLQPLGMTATLVDPRGDVPGLAVPYGEKDPAVRSSRWTFDASSPSGAGVSSLRDLSRLLAWHLGAEQPGPRLAPGTLREMLEPQRMAPDWSFGVGLGWHVGRVSTIGAYPWHSGMTGGYACAVAFSPRYRTGVVLLSNAATPTLTQGIGDVLLKAVQVYGAERPPEIPPEVEQLVARLRAGFASPPPAALKDEFSPEFLRSVPFEKIAETFGSLFGLHGACTGHRFDRPDNDWPYRVAFKMADGKERACYLAVDASSRPRVTGMMFLR